MSAADLAQNWRDVDDVQDDDEREGECQRCGAARSLDYDGDTGLYLCDPCMKTVGRRRAHSRTSGWRGQL